MIALQTNTFIPQGTNRMLKIFKEGALDEWREFRDDIAKEYGQLNKDCKQFKNRLMTQQRVKEGEIRKQIRAYERELTSSDYVSKLNESIRNTIPSAKSLIDYYESRPKLTEYTLTTELSRMEYTVWTAEGKKLTSPSEILSYHTEVAAESRNNDDLLWRCANQSILGDVIAALTSEDGLIRPQLQAGTFADDVSIVVDLGCSNPYVRAECFLNVSIPDKNGERVQLAGALVSVYLCPSRQEFHANLSQVFPCKALSHNQVNRVAKGILS